MRFILLLLSLLGVVTMTQVGVAQNADDPDTPVAPRLPMDELEENNPELWDRLRRFFESEDSDLTEEEAQRLLEDEGYDWQPGPGCTITEEELQEFYDQYEMM